MPSKSSSTSGDQLAGWLIAILLGFSSISYAHDWPPLAEPSQSCQSIYTPQLPGKWKPDHNECHTPEEWGRLAIHWCNIEWNTPAAVTSNLGYARNPAQAQAAFTASQFCGGYMWAFSMTQPPTASLPWCHMTTDTMCRFIHNGKDYVKLTVGDGETARLLPCLNNNCTASLALAKLPKE
jgi:hypothetical protein